MKVLTWIKEQAISWLALKLAGILALLGTAAYGIAESAFLQNIIGKTSSKTIVRVVLILVLGNIAQATWLIYLRFEKTPERIRRKFRLDISSGIRYHKKTGHRFCNKCLYDKPSEIVQLTIAPISTDWATHWQCLKCGTQYSERLGGPTVA